MLLGLTIFVCIIVMNILPLYIKYRNSNYQFESGVSLIQLFIDKGLYGEFLIFMELEKYPGPKKILSNIYLNKAEGTTEVDLIMINKYGIYVIESKNYSGTIYGSDKNKRWAQYLQGKKFNFFNPVWQNSAHITALLELFNIPDLAIMNSFIVFSNRSTLKKIEITKSEVKILQRKDLLRTLKKEEETKSVVLSATEINQIYLQLRRYSLADKQRKQDHINYVRQKIN